MRVLLVHDYGALIGGAEYMTMALRDGMRARGHDVRLFASSASRPGLPASADYLCYGTESMSRRFTQVMNPSAATTLRRVLAQFAPEVVHVRSFLTQLSPSIMPVLQGTPALLHVVDYQLICPLQSKRLPDGSACVYQAGMVCRDKGCVSLAGVGRTLAQRTMWDRWNGCFNVVAANSDWTARRLRDDGVRVDRTIWNGVPVVARRGPLSEPPTVAYAGRLSPEKGVDVLMRAFVRVRQFVSDARLLIAGDGPSRESLGALARELGMHEAVTFLGRVPRAELDARIGAAWVQAAPSLWEEPFGLVAAESMMRGTGVVATNTGGLSEFVREENGGLTVPPGDAIALGDALVRFCTDRAFSERMGEAARTFATMELAEGRCFERFENLYAEIVRK